MDHQSLFPSVSTGAHRVYTGRVKTMSVRRSLKATNFG